MQEEYFQQLHDQLDTIADYVRIKDPDFSLIQISDASGWNLDYRDYRYVYLWLPSVSLTLSFDDYGSGLLQPLTWIQVNFRPGTFIRTSGQTSLTPIHIQWSDVQL